jgi:hypothetical protein
MTDKLQPTRQPPRLLDLVRKFGGYDKITPEGWADWDRETAEYRADVATGVLWRKPDADRREPSNAPRKPR